MWFLSSLLGILMLLLFLQKEFFYGLIRWDWNTPLAFLRRRQISVMSSTEAGAISLFQSTLKKKIKLTLFINVIQILFLLGCVWNNHPLLQLEIEFLKEYLSYVTAFMLHLELKWLLCIYMNMILKNEFWPLLRRWFSCRY